MDTVPQSESDFISKDVKFCFEQETALCLIFADVNNEKHELLLLCIFWFCCFTLLEVRWRRDKTSKQNEEDEAEEDEKETKDKRKTEEEETDLMLEQKPAEAASCSPASLDSPTPDEGSWTALGCNPFCGGSVQPLHTLVITRVQSSSVIMEEIIKLCSDNSDLEIARSHKFSFCVSVCARCSTLKQTLAHHIQQILSKCPSSPERSIEQESKLQK